MQKFDYPIRPMSAASRPTFLTILCFLTFMNTVAGLWTQSERLWNPEITAEATKETFERLRERLEDNSAAADTKSMDIMFDAVNEQTNAGSMQTSAIIMLIFESLCLYAAYLMWTLEKKGFYLYLGATALVFLAPLFLLGGWLGVITSLAAFIPSMLMSILYAFNLRHMA